MSKWYPCIYCTEDLHCSKYSTDNIESWCVLGPCSAETPSHGDQIRRMSDEELAEFFMKISDKICTKPNRYCDGLHCQSCAIDWLKQEAKEDA